MSSHGGAVLKLGILLSGRGSNMMAIFNAIAEGRLDSTISVVISDNPSAKGIELAKENGLKTITVDPKQFSSKLDYEKNVLKHLKLEQVTCIVLAGYMRLLGDTLLEAYSNSILNIHPSLLPKHKGLHPQRQAIEDGSKLSGCTVHLVNEELDGGPILGQKRVSILNDDNEDTLASKILVQEHLLYSEVLRDIELGNIKIGS